MTRGPRLAWRAARDGRPDTLAPYCRQWTVTPADHAGNTYCGTLNSAIAFLSPAIVMSAR